MNRKKPTPKPKKTQSTTQLSNILKKTSADTIKLFSKSKVKEKVAEKPKVKAPEYKTVKELFKKAKWIKEAFAKDALGAEITEDSPNATQFCLAGAINRVYPKYLTRLEILNKVEKVIRAIRKKGKNEIVCIEAYNDDKETKWADIKKVIDKANI